MEIQDQTPIQLVNYTRIFLRVAEQLGANRKKLLQDSGITEELLQCDGESITFKQYQKLYLSAKKHVPVPTLFLEYGANLNMTDHGRVGYAAITSPSFDSALQVVVKYLTLLGRYYQMNLNITDGVATISFDVKTQLKELYVAEIEQFAAGLYHTAKTGPLDLPNFHSIKFSYPEPSYSHAYRDLFGNICEFDAETNEFCFSIKELQQFWLKKDPVINEVAIQLCEEAYNDIEKSASYRDRVREIVIQFPDRFPTQKQVAEALKLPVRTLARYLEKEHTTYQVVIDELRLEIAKRYLRSSKLTIDEIAEFIGFSTGASFSRSFKKWTGKSPSEYR